MRRPIHHRERRWSRPAGALLILAALAVLLSVSPARAQDRGEHWDARRARATDTRHHGEALRRDRGHHRRDARPRSGHRRRHDGEHRARSRRHHRRQHIRRDVRRHIRHDRFRGHRVDGYRHFRIPHRLAFGHHHGRYARYYLEDIWFRAHHHHHRVFVFPVYTGFHWEYRPFAYCGERLYGEAHVSLRGRHIDLDLAF